jgi:hypothetical protein
MCNGFNAFRPLIERIRCDYCQEIEDWYEAQPEAKWGKNLGVPPDPQKKRKVLPW